MSDNTQDKAYIKDLISNEELECVFRPKEFTFSKKNDWTPGKVVGAQLQPPQFTGSAPMELQMELLFDTYEAGTDVREKTGKLWKMMKLSEQRRDPNTNTSEPPHVEFRWGAFYSFKAVITTLSEKFTLFLSTGVPVRSLVSVRFLQAQDIERWPAQNPTSGGREGYAMHVVKQGETIDWIAFAEYGSSNAWRQLADANHLDDPSNLQPGQRLLIPPLND
ncbi:MAG: LysM peptidoglycan-binding domain-containing protein [Chloroflexi bacterium]|nr:LysM peptidoglycan-binding domain-containing protein [Chloroflexota bacterium]